MKHVAQPENSRRLAAANADYAAADAIQRMLHYISETRS